MAVRTTMNVSLTPELQQFVTELVHTGRYHSASEVLRESLRLLEHSERWRLLEKAVIEGLTPEEEAKLPADSLSKTRSEIHAKIQEGFDPLERGDVVDGEEFFSRWRRRIAAAGGSDKQSKPQGRA